MSLTPTAATRSTDRFSFSATAVIPAPPADVYHVFADYRTAHPKVLPPRFFGALTVLEGGYGEGTVLTVEGKFMGRTRVLRGAATEPEPGRRLVETYAEDDMVTSFVVEPHDGGRASRVTISTEMPRKPGIAGWIEERLVPRFLKPVYQEELGLVAAYVAAHGSAGVR